MTQLPKVASSEEMVPLEQRYRRLLRLLPASYRAVWEEEMVATFLDSMHTDDAQEAEYRAYCGRPSRAERASVVALALRLRLGGVEAPPRSFLWGEAVRRLALIGLLVYAVEGTVTATHILWGSRDPDGLAEATAMISRGWLSLELAWSVSWMGAYAALVFGHRRTATVIAGFGLALTLATGVLATVTMPEFLAPGTLTIWTELLLAVAVVLALAGFHRDAPAARRRPWLVTYAAGVALTGALQLVVLLRPALFMELLDRYTVWSVALLAAGLVHLYANPSGTRRAPVWPLTLALAASGVVGLRLVFVTDYVLVGDARIWDTPAWMAATIVETVAVAAVGALLAIRAAHTLRDPSSSPPVPAATGTPSC